MPDHARFAVAEDNTDDEATLRAALRAVSGLGEVGLCTVPAKPSADMLAAGARAGGVSVEIAWKVYQAMVTAGA